MPCLKCARGLHSLCSNNQNGGCESCHPVGVSQTQTLGQSADLTLVDEEVEFEENGNFSTTKLDSSLKDQQSTGRKRAARLYPLDREAACEWRGLQQAGGGEMPIVGCTDGLQQARHHGPDYNTLNNDPGNVHRICHRCHNRWHAANDVFKSESYLKAYGHKVKAEHLSQTAKDLRSGVVNS